MGRQYAGELRYVAKCSNGVILEVPVEAGFQVMYDAIKRELKSEVGQSLFYDCASCDVFVAYVVERIGSGCFQSQYCFEKRSVLRLHLVLISLHLSIIGGNEMVDSMIGYLAVCKTGLEYFRPDLQELIDSIDPFEKPARIYHCLRNIVYKRDTIDCIMYTEKSFVMEVKPDGH